MAELPDVNATFTPTPTLVTSHFLLATTGNASDNSSSALTPFFEESMAFVVMRRLLAVLTPVICLLGIVGNVVATATFLGPGLNKTSCCFYLAAKCVNDIGFLLTLLVVWLHSFRVPLFTTPGVCHITVFLTYVCGCLSVWFVVFITAENLARLARPRLVRKYCNVPAARRVVAVTTIASAAFYNFSLWTTGVTDTPGVGKSCTSLEDFQQVVLATTVIDTTLTLIVPSVLMFFLLAAIVFKSMESFERRKRLRGSSTGTALLASSTPEEEKKKKKKEEKEKKRHSPEGKMTTFLFALSIVFLCLNLPTHAIRLKLLIQFYVYHSPPSYTDTVLRRIFEVLLYFNFSTNCLVYLLFGERFRIVFKAMYLARCCPEPAKQVESAAQGGGGGGRACEASSSVALGVKRASVGREMSVEASTACVTYTNDGATV